MAASEHEREWLAQEHILVHVTLDAGVFHWLNEMIESKHQTQRYADWIPWYQGLVDRAHEQFQAAINSNGETLDQGEDEKPHRVIRRRVGKEGGSG